MTRARTLALCLVLVCARPSYATAQEIPRSILALYDSRYDEEIAFTPTHMMAEMPLNHLGLKVRYHDVNRPLPSLEQMEDVRGILTWFQSDDMADPLGFLTWAEAAIDAGKRFVVIGDLSTSRDLDGNLIPVEDVNRFWSRVGLRSQNEFNNITYDWQIVYRDTEVMEFERSLTGVLPGFSSMKQNDPRLRVHLSVRRGNDARTDSVLAATGPNGGYVGSGYTHFADTESVQRRWYLNPFEFFRLAFDTDPFPKPDTTTLSGRRIFYSHIDGDGWRNRSEIERYRDRGALSSEVVLTEVLEVFPDLPVTVAPIAADLDPEWQGNEESLRIARRVLALPHIEAGTHTYSHPLEWAALADTTTEEVAGPGLLSGTWKALRDILGLAPPPITDAGTLTESGSKKYDSPASFDRLPFSLEREVDGSVAFINALLPPGKRVEILQWSGDTAPFEAALEAVSNANLRNLNGGDSRFDAEYLSYGWVSPLGRQVGNKIQVYASNSNENTYTELWTDQFFGFKHLVKTIENTESPIRIKPHNVYYHMYSGERQASLSAVLENYQYARSLEIAPITTSNYAAIVDGFFTTRITALGETTWRIEDRDRIQTVRFDRATQRSVDFERSSGVVGQRHYQGSLYVALDSSNSAPVVALKEGEEASQGRPYLAHGRWQVSDLGVDVAGFGFDAQGFGPCDLVWHVRPNQIFLVDITPEGGNRWQQRVRSDGLGTLRLELGSTGIKPLRVVLTREEN